MSCLLLRLLLKLTHSRFLERTVSLRVLEVALASLNALTKSCLECQHQNYCLRIDNKSYNGFALKVIL